MKTLLAYGLLGLPLAMVALPVYVQAPTFYAARLGLPLGLTGLVLFAARLFDTVQDPWLGRLIDVLYQRGQLRRLLWGAALLLALAFYGLWRPPLGGTTALAVWFALMLGGCYLAHSVLNIAYLAWGARLAERQRVAAAAWREGAGLVGVVVASVVPAWLLHQPAAFAERGLGGFALGFALLLGVALAALFAAAPVWCERGEPRSNWRAPLANPAFRRLLLPYFLNALSVSIPATLALFFIDDRIGAPQWAGGFLAAYFLAGAAGLPAWTRLAGWLGVASAWRWGMLAAVVAFASAATLGPGEAWAYLAVCVLAGLALGADLALPPVLLARLIPAEQAPAGYFGLWSLLGKLALALSGLALPLLAQLGYRPGHAGEAGLALALVYAGLPCLIKLLALVTLRGGWLERPVAAAS
ncbi:MFS transporter [Crenobacter sp. SG2305]|uniref:MFS transporter n=1 Tax=Crenobacter oryzisoli TaxID=3056844 RepID=UPI0025AA7D64|nr:MFS transporter [Crenobacter sp. SG2305]MDN0082835.1 MFS transporter [Crenobacter sp. SG2305]